MELVSKYEVIVVGGGPAGIMAAIAAARNGARTLLIERLGFLGGEIIAGLILHGFHNQRGEQVVHGIPGELIDRLRAQGSAVKRVEIVKHPYHAAAMSVDHEVLKYMAMEMVLEAGADVQLHSVFTDVVLEGNAVRGVTVYSKSGYQTFLADAVVDATGDGDVAVRAGARFELGRTLDGLTQPLSLFFTLGGMNLGRFVEAMGLGYGVSADTVAGKEPGQIMWIKGTIEPWADEAATENLFPHVKDKHSIRFAANAFHPGEMNVNATFVNELDGTNVSDLTRAEIECRRQAMHLASFLKKHVPGCEDSYVVRTAPHIGIRETRRVIGDYYITYEDFLNEERFEDVIARSGFFADVHDPRPTGATYTPPKGNMSKSHGDFDIPYRALLPAGIDRLILAGRCISASAEALASARVAGPVMAMGQAAGTAASMAVRTGKTPRGLAVGELQARLREQGADLG